jgi:hypothetical protein
MEIVLSGYTIKDHAIGRSITKQIHPELIDRFLLSSDKKSKIKRFKRDNGTTRLVLNRTKIKELLDNIDLLMPKNKNEDNLFVQRLNENKKMLQQLWDEGGITAVVNEDQKVVVTVY